MVREHLYVSPELSQPQAKSDFDQECQNVNTGYPKNEFFEEPNSLSDRDKDSFDKVKSIDAVVLPGLLVKGLLPASPCLYMAWNLFIVAAGSLFVIILLTTSFFLTHSSSLDKITNFTKALSSLSVSTIQAFHSYRVLTPLNIAILLLMITIPALEVLC